MIPYIFNVSPCDCYVSYVNLYESFMLSMSSSTTINMYVAELLNYRIEIEFLQSFLDCVMQIRL